MAEKKKMSVAEIMAAARKSDAKGGQPASAPPVEEAASAAATGETEEAVAKPVPKAAAPKPATAPGQRPSVKDIMALARAGGGKPKDGDAPAAAVAVEEKPAPKPAAKAPAEKSAPKVAAKADAAVSAGPKDTGSILAAARKTARPGPMSKEEAASRGATAVAEPKEPPKKEKLAVPAMPAKPAAAKKPAAGAVEEDRRSFISAALGTALGLGFTALAATGGLWTLGFARFMFPNILTEPPSKFKVGFPDAFAPGAVETKFVAQYGVWVVKGEFNGQPEIYALRTVCTHLGCTPNWLEAEQKFKCPCHGSGFYKDGINFEGPAPRPLERYAIHLADDGQLEIDKSRIFQEELGQWSDPASFVPA